MSAKNRKFSEDYKFGFTFIEKDELQLPQCLISNDSMRPNRLERHLKQQHPILVLTAKDGAPAMIGVLSDLAKQLKEKIPQYTLCYS
nr:unnamed protein product [Callosobruchus analis]